MKHVFLSLILLLPALSQEVPLAEAYLIDRDGGANRVWIEKASKDTIQYRENPQSLNKKQVRTAGLTAFFPKPANFKAAETNFRTQKFLAARNQFKTIAENLKGFDDIPGNLSTLAGFYELECARELGDYEGLETLMNKFQPGPLLGEHRKTQIKLYPLYNAVRTKDWQRLSLLCKEWNDVELPPSLRIQVNYCEGLALKGQEKANQALFKLNDAIVADYGRSRNVVKKAILACLEIYEAMPQVKRALKVAGTENADPNSRGARLLTEARGLANLWNKGLGNGQALPQAFAVFAQ